METTAKVLLFLLLIFSPPLAATGKPAKPPPQQPTQTQTQSQTLNVPDSGGSYSTLGKVFAGGLAICGLCYLADGCRIPFTQKYFCKPAAPEHADADRHRVTPDIPKNEYTYDIKPDAKP